MRRWAWVLLALALCACASVAINRDAPPAPERFVWTCFAIVPKFLPPGFQRAKRVPPATVAVQCWIADRHARLVGVLTLWPMPPPKPEPSA